MVAFVMLDQSGDVVENLAASDAARREFGWKLLVMIKVKFTNQKGRCSQLCEEAMWFM